MIDQRSRFAAGLIAAPRPPHALRQHLGPSSPPTVRAASRAARHPFDHRARCESGFETPLCLPCALPSHLRDTHLPTVRIAIPPSRHLLTHRARCLLGSRETIAHRMRSDRASPIPIENRTRWPSAPPETRSALAVPPRMSRIPCRIDFFQIRRAHRSPSSTLARYACVHRYHCTS